MFLKPDASITQGYLRSRPLALRFCEGVKVGGVTLGDGVCVSDTQTNQLTLMPNSVCLRAHVSLVPEAPTGSNEGSALETSAGAMPRQSYAPEFTANCFVNIVVMPLVDYKSFEAIFELGCGAGLPQDNLQSGVEVSQSTRLNPR